VEACPVCPSNPRLPNPGHQPTQGSARAYIFEQPNEATRFDNAAKLPKGRHLKIVGQDTEQESRHSRIERAGRKLKLRHVHLVEPSPRSNGWASTTRSRQHRRAGIDPGNDRIGRIEGAIPTGPNTYVEQPTAEIPKQQ